MTGVTKRTSSKFKPSMVEGGARTAVDVGLGLSPAAQRRMSSILLEEWLGKSEDHYPTSISKPPDLPQRCSTEEEIENYQDKVDKYHTELVRTMHTLPRTYNWYLAPNWEKWYSKPSTSVVWANVEKHFETARVYYLPHFVAKEELPRLIAAVPAVCTPGDDYLQLASSYEAQDPVSYDVSKEGPLRGKGSGWIRDYAKQVLLSKSDERTHTHRDLSAAINARPQLLDIFERRRSRMKCIASSVDLFATHGFPDGFPRRIRDVNRIRQDIVVITGSAPQFCTSYLDYADLILSEADYGSRLQCYDRLGQLPRSFNEAWAIADKEDKLTKQTQFKILPGRRLFHISGYVQTMKDCFFLWLRAFDDQVRRMSHDRKGYLQIQAIGCNAFANLPEWMAEYKDFAHTLMPLLIQVVEEVLDQNYFPNIIKVGFCDFSGLALFSPNKEFRGHITTMPCSREDICKFDDKEHENYICGMLNPGNSFSLPGNKHGYSSVESQIGENTTLRIVQNWINNQNLVDSRYHIAVDGPSQLLAGHKTSVGMPCIIGDATSVQEYTWAGDEQPVIIGAIQREEGP